MLRRTQIYLTEAQYHALLDRARRNGTPMAAQIRAAIEEYLAKGEGRSDWEEDPIWRIAGHARPTKTHPKKDRPI